VNQADGGCSTSLSHFSDRLLGRDAATSFIMQDQEGREHEHRVVFQTVEPPHSLVYVHYVDGRPYAHARLTFKETEVEGEPGTRVILRWNCAEILAEDPRTYILAIEVAEQILARLAASVDPERSCASPPAHRSSSSG
jgi:uncharacterized protein YndB with AHSA1/START domain